jgi:hypothetical protein
MRRGYMSSRLVAAFAMVAVLSSAARGQTHAEVDSLIAHFVDVGLVSWSPGYLFQGCPDLADWQEYGFQRLAAMELPWYRERSLANSWSHALRNCGDARLEQWFFDRFDAAILRGDVRARYSIVVALGWADSPRIRDFLWNRMIDTSQPESGRAWAGGLYFRRLTPEEQVREYLRVFEMNRLPYNVAWAVPAYLMPAGHARAFMDGMAPLVRADPALANQPAFSQVVQTADYADHSDRERLAAALEAGLAARPGRVTAEERRRLEASIAHLRRPR